MRRGRLRFMAGKWASGDHSTMAAAAARQASGLLEPQRQLAGVDVVEQRPGALVEHVGVEAVRFQQRDAPLPAGALGLERGELTAELRDLLVEVLLGAQPAVAGIGV